MLIWLTDWLQQFDAGFNVFSYLTMRAILSTGYNGYVAQEFIPTYEDKLQALKEAILICDV